MTCIRWSKGASWFSAASRFRTAKVSMVIPDADVLMHAICDAVLGALGEADIGHFFPNTDSRWRNARSKVFLEEAARQVNFRQGQIVNVDATIIAQEPKVAPHIQSMKENIAAALGAEHQPRRG
jgi:2-C-methyl-D-erythritol 2,4-cyclodiphosphate synthase